MLEYKPIIQAINSQLFSQKKVTVSVLRLDLIHEKISGNKWFKLKNNLEAARREGYDTVLTFGGAFSNHIHATAAACKEAGFKCMGVIRGEESSKGNPTLSAARTLGMHLHFVSREEYTQKHTEEFQNNLREKFGRFYLIPEGGNNLLGAEGCSEILEEISTEYNYIFCACGTGTTFAGLSQSVKSDQKLIGISVLKGEQTMIEEVRKQIHELGGNLQMKNNNALLHEKPISSSGILNSHHFGGYAKHTEELINFKSNFEFKTGIPLDYIYTSKLFYAVFDLIEKDMLPENSKALIIHSGGLQGNAGYEDRYDLKPIRIVSEPQG